MKLSQIIKTLRKFETITPDKAYSERSRNIILSTPFTPKIHENISLSAATEDLRTISIASFFESSWRTLAVAGAVAALIAAIYFTTSQLSPLFLPGLNQGGVVAEAQMVNTSIDVQLSHIQRFEEDASESASALKGVASNAPSHLSESVIKSEQFGITSATPSNPSASTTDAVNSILNELTK